MSGIDLDSLFSSTEQKYGLPPGILRATAKVESSFNPRAVSDQGAVGLMQMLPTTAKGLGVNPNDPTQAVDGAGRLWAQNLKATGGDIDRAAMMYHGGTDTRQWGPKTHAYPQKLAAALGPQQPQPGGGDPIEAALSGHPQAPQNAPQQADPSDPIESALVHGNSAPSAAQNPNVPAANPSDQAGYSGAGAGGRALERPGSGGAPGAAGSEAQGGALHQLAQVAEGSVNAGLNGLSAGLIKPVDALIDTVVPLAAVGDHNAAQKAWDGKGFLSAFHNNLAAERAAASNFMDQHPGIAIGSNIAGGFASPLNKIFAPAEGQGFVRSIPNFMAQGATFGGLEGASDTGTVDGTLKGAGIGAAVGPVAAAGGAALGKALGAVAQAPGLAKALLSNSVKSKVADMIDHGATVDQIVEAVPEAKELAHVSDWVSYRANGGKDPVSFTGPPAAANDASPEMTATVTVSRAKRLASALGTQGSRRGVEAVSDVPQQVASDVQRLTSAGVSPDEAQREADILYVGAKPTVAAVTRDPKEQWAFNEGAKDTSSPTGQMLNDTQAGNNQALHDTTIKTVEDLGGVPAQGEPAQKAAEALAQASDAARAKTTQLYASARAKDGDVKINTDELRALLQSPEMATPTNPQVKQLVDGISAHIQAVDQRAGTTLRTPDQMEDIRQLANDAFDPMGGQVNHAVRKIGKALDDGLDQLDEASAAYRAARSAHRDWATQYADPEGIAKLTRRDASGTFLNADKWRLSENGLVSRLDDKPFSQVVGQLKKIGATDALNKLKASIVQQAYERATNTARDKLGNPVVNGKLFQQELNKIGMPKLKALFSPDEIAHLATIGRAARHLNEPVPGTINTSNTAVATQRSSLAAALSRKPSKHPAITILKYGAGVTGHLPAAAAIHGAEHLSGHAVKAAISQGVREQLNTGLARAMAAKSINSIERASSRAALGRALRDRGASSASEDKRHAL